MAATQRLFTVAGALGATALCTLLQVAPALADTSSPSTAGEFVAAINSLRASHGTRALNVNTSLSSIAQAWSVRLSGAGTLSHNPALAGLAPTGWRMLGENVGVGPDEPALQQAFANSPEHYANMVNPSFTSIGVGVYTTSQGYLWVTEDYMESPGAVPITALASAPAHRVAALPPTSPAPAPVIARTISVSSPSSPAPVVRPLMASPLAPHRAPVGAVAPASAAPALPPLPAPTAAGAGQMVVAVQAATSRLVVPPAPATARTRPGAPDPMTRGPVPHAIRLGGLVFGLTSLIVALQHRRSGAFSRRRPWVPGV
jgi:hypothetical protein